MMLTLSMEKIMGFTRIFANPWRGLAIAFSIASIALLVGCSSGGGGTNDGGGSDVCASISEGTLCANLNIGESRDLDTVSDDCDGDGELDSIRTAQRGTLTIGLTPTTTLLTQFPAGLIVESYTVSYSPLSQGERGPILPSRVFDATSSTVNSAISDTDLELTAEIDIAGVDQAGIKNVYNDLIERSVTSVTTKVTFLVSVSGDTPVTLKSDTPIPVTVTDTAVTVNEDTTATLLGATPVELAAPVTLNGFTIASQLSLPHMTSVTLPAGTIVAPAPGAIPVDDTPLAGGTTVNLADETVVIVDLTLTNIIPIYGYNITVVARGKTLSGERFTLAPRQTIYLGDFNTCD